MNLYRYLETHGAWDPPAVFLREPATGRTVTYAELDQWTGRIARHLVEAFGVQPGDRVAAQLEKSPQAFFVYLACLRAGAVFLPLNPAYQPDEVGYFLTDAEPRIFVCEPSFRARMEAPCSRAGARLLTLGVLGDGDLFAGMPASDKTPAFPTVERAPDELAAILYTSGTTGRSKGALLTHGNLAANARALSESWGFTRADRLLHALPIFHVHGLFISLHCTLMSGSTVLWLPRFDVREVLGRLPEATVFMGVPTYYTRLLESPAFTRELAAPLRLFVSGSAPLRTETFAEFETRAGVRILERYGMTETGIITSNPLQAERRAGTVGFALPGVEVRIEASSGMIEVRGPNVFSGYWKKPPRAGDDFTPDGYFRTGDLGERDADGYLRISGRAKDLVISGGFNVYPRELELLLDEAPEIGESAVFGVPHPDFGEAVVAAVVLKVGRSLDEPLLIEKLRKKVAAFKAPKRIFAVTELPRNTMGKVQKNELRRRFSNTFQLARK